MNLGQRILVRILITVVCYVITFVGAFYALVTIGDNNPIAWAIVIILAIFGFRAIKYLPSLFFSSGGSGEGLFFTLLFLFLKLLLSVVAGVFIAPWVIGGKIAALIPGGAAEEPAETEDE